MARPLLPDGLWEIIEPLLPRSSPSPREGHPPSRPERLTGLPWEDSSGAG